MHGQDTSKAVQRMPYLLETFFVSTFFVLFCCLPYFSKQKDYHQWQKWDAPLPAQCQPWRTASAPVTQQRLVRLKASCVTRIHWRMPQCKTCCVPQGLTTTLVGAPSVAWVWEGDATSKPGAGASAISDAGSSQGSDVRHLGIYLDAECRKPPATHSARFWQALLPSI